MCFFFFFNDTATTEIYTLSLHDALPIYDHHQHVDRALDGKGGGPDEGLIGGEQRAGDARVDGADGERLDLVAGRRSEEHTSELQSRQYLVCRLLLEKKKKKDDTSYISTS